MSFPSAARYLTERLGISARKARALVALERKTWTAPALGDAYRTGALSSLQALTVLPVIAERTAGEWVAHAQEVTLRRLADEVEWALTVRDGLMPIAPPPARASLAVPERQMCARPEWEWPDAEIVFTAPVSVVALFRSAVVAFAHPADSLPGGLEQLLLHVKAEWEGQPRHRDPVFARDGWRRAVPVCTARGGSCTITTSSSARMAGGTAARIASRSARGTTCPAFTRAASVPGARRRRARRTPPAAPGRRSRVRDFAGEWASTADAMREPTGACPF